MGMKAGMFRSRRMKTLSRWIEVALFVAGMALLWRPLVG
jgi:hypothetical protein